MALRDDLLTQFATDGLPAELVDLTLQAAQLVGAEFYALPANPFGAISGVGVQAVPATPGTVTAVVGRPGWSVGVIDGGVAGDVVWVSTHNGRALIAPRMA